MDKSTNYAINKYQLSALVICRVLIGWHLLYEGAVKMLNPDWSAAGYLLDSEGLFKQWFLWMVDTEIILNAIDIIIQWGLILIGLALILGLLARYASIAGAIMILMFYLSHPPVIGSEYMMPSEGSYLLVNKNAIECCILVVLFLIPSSYYIGIDRLLFKNKRI
ncbi:MULTISPECIES: DoxX subfamily [unclassified Saccharicrinis]|uniref:DoxX subfamily n=1 Tax=unclassified Saccharicrinis TaxID=2646859 RepID=UPI003D32E497